MVGSAQQGPPSQNTRLHACSTPANRLKQPRLFLLGSPRRQWQTAGRSAEVRAPHAVLWTPSAEGCCPLSSQSKALTVLLAAPERLLTETGVLANGLSEVEALAEPEQWRPRRRWPSPIWQPSQLRRPSREGLVAASSYPRGTPLDGLMKLART
jgi:hypothetical protein